MSKTNVLIVHTLPHVRTQLALLFLRQEGCTVSVADSMPAASEWTTLEQDLIVTEASLLNALATGRQTE